MQVRAPLPIAQFVVPVDYDTDSLQTLRDRICDVISRRYPSNLLNEINPEALCLSLDEFELVDEFGTRVLHDGDTITYVF